jgi:hypothetical protein
MGKKSTRIVVRQRIAHIFGMLVDGYSRSDIMQYCAEHYGIAERQVDTYIEHCNDKLEHMERGSYEKRLNKAIERTTRLYHRCLTAKDRRSANIANKELNELEGVKNFRVIHSGDKKNPVSVQVEELTGDRLIEELKNRGLPTDILEK